MILSPRTGLRTCTFAQVLGDFEEERAAVKIIRIRRFRGVSVDPQLFPCWFPRIRLAKLAPR